MIQALNGTQLLGATLRADVDRGPLRPARAAATDAAGQQVAAPGGSGAEEAAAAAVERLPTAVTEAAVAAPGSLPSVARMKRDELIEECEARGLPADGTAAELRSRLRKARELRRALGTAW